MTQKQTRYQRDSRKPYEARYRHMLKQVMAFMGDNLPGSVGDVAQEAGLSVTTVSKIVDGLTRYPEVRSLIKLGLACGVTWTMKNDGTVECNVRKITAKHLKRAKAL